MESPPCPLSLYFIPMLAPGHLIPLFEMSCIFSDMFHPWTANLAIKLRIPRIEMSCIFSDMFHPWTADLAIKLRIPRIVFHATCIFAMTLKDSMRKPNSPHLYVQSDDEPFLIPGLPNPITMIRSVLPMSLPPKMERKVSPMATLLFITVLITADYFSESQAQSNSSFQDNFSIMWSEHHFKTSPDGQIWYLSLDNDTGCGFQTKQRYRFGWFSMKLKLVGGDSAGVVTAYYMCSENGAGPTRDELDIVFLGNRTGQPYLIQTNVYKNGTGNREMRHQLWFDPTEDFHSYSILWNSHQILFFVDQVPIRVFKNADYANNFFPNEKPMYLFSSIWDADNWATRGGLEKTNWTNAPFVSSYKDFSVDACQWEDPYPPCVSTTTNNWWDQYAAWHLTDQQKTDFAWVERNLVIYDYCQDTKRFPTLPEECSLSPWN